MAHPLYGKAVVEYSEIAHIRDMWLVVMLRLRRSALRHKLTEECRLLIAPCEHGRNGLGQLRRVWWFSHSASNHDWVSYIFLIT